MKKILILAVAFAMVFCFAACGSSESAEPAETEVAETEESAEPEGVIAGGWEILAEPAAAELPKDVQAAYDNFMKNYDDELIPMAYYGNQVTEEMNYGLLCKSKSDNELQTVVMQQQPNGNVDGAIVNTFNIADYTEGEGAEATEPLDGGWNVAEDYTTTELPEAAQNAFDKAAEQFVGNDLVPMAYLGKQIVAGTNYALLCHSTLVTAEPVSSIQVVVIYEDLEGNCEITNINTLDLASFAEE